LDKNSGQCGRETACLTSVSQELVIRFLKFYCTLASRHTSVLSVRIGTFNCIAVKIVKQHNHTHAIMKIQIMYANDVHVLPVMSLI
jgi:hypothetical protein